MSAGTAESIPTSSDPRSKRPVKRRALTPVSAQAATVESLFARPDQEIRLPPGSGAVAVAQRAVPEIVTNVQGSSAGAGSGEFHVYKASRRREYERLRRMDDEVKQEEAEEAFEREKREREERDAEKTKKNREKREKKKKARAKGGASKGGAEGGGDGVKTGEGAAKSIQPRIRVDGPEGETSNGQGANGTGTPAGTAVVSDGPGLLIRDDDD